MKQHRKLLVIHGPNMNLLGNRQRELYGKTTLSVLNRTLKAEARQNRVALEFFQSNHEGELVSKIQQRGPAVDGILINPAAYTHTSVAIRDALVAVGTPTVEVHLTNIYQREPFRQRSLISDVVDGQVIGFGIQSYQLGLHALLQLTQHPPTRQAP